MTTRVSQKPNTLAIAGFLAPFVAAGITGVLILALGEAITRSWISLIYVILVPLVLTAGIACGIKSLPLVEKLGDRDYAYSGLVLNMLFALVYLVSLGYFFGFAGN